ncbi:cation:dicarboxylate symporter family transporter, partial [Citrobacter freundii]|uniref:cation:dicarboxylate symporter family transporter n=1 Tax=Citrobacter freundii TaxID=546 RepID=UPI001F49BDDE
VSQHARHHRTVHYFKTVWPVLTFAFVSRSSAASIPLAISAQEKFGVQNTIAGTSVIVALFIGGLEALGLLSDAFSLQGGLW